MVHSMAGRAAGTTPKRIVVRKEMRRPATVQPPPHLQVGPFALKFFISTHQVGHPFTKAITNVVSNVAPGLTLARLRHTRSLQPECSSRSIVSSFAVAPTRSLNRSLFIAITSKAEQSVIVPFLPDALFNQHV